jgi:hypothetical protein
MQSCPINLGSGFNRTGWFNRDDFYSVILALACVNAQ